MTRLLFDQADLDRDLKLGYEEFKAFLRLNIEAGSLDSLIQALDEDLVIEESFRWIDMDMDGGLDWNEVWDHVQEEQTLESEADGWGAVWDETETEANTEESEVAVDERSEVTALPNRYRSGHKIALLSRVEEMSGIGYPADLKLLVN
jgi:hypothetical protein